MPKVIVNPDKDFVKELRERIKLNEGYCPCEVQKTKDTYCPCKTFRDTAQCHCGLYVRKE